MTIKSVITSFLLLTFCACTAQKPEKSHTIQLSKGELFLAVIGHQMKGKEALLKDYFGVVFPPAQKNGFTPLGQLPIDNIAAGNFMPNEFVGLFKWPNIESVQAFMGEVNPEKLTLLRQGIWSELKQNMVVFMEDTQITFKENKTYEVKMIWGDVMFDAQKISKHRGRILVNSPIAGYEDLAKNTAPNSLVIIEWPNQKAANSYRKKNQLKADKEEAFYTHFAFPEAK